MGLLIGVAAFLVSVTDRAVERRAQVTAVTLIGARARTMRAVQCLQVVLPLGLGLGLAVVTGKLAESSYLITGGGSIRWDVAGIPLLLLAAAGAVGTAAAGSLPLGCLVAVTPADRSAEDAPRRLMTGPGLPAVGLRRHAAGA
ncbi:hypothetical protein ACFV2H_08825 [Streptomyces sp. NPDC059629]|uniref:hypothetical protein n=1 Tax=Streptomyces sp. NPDC059629 TaxID=3346889 RepID=UPI0036ADA84F